MSSKKSLIERPVFVLLVAAFGFFLLSFIAMGIAPWLTFVPLMKDQNVIKNPYYDEEGRINSAGRGRQIYIREACWHCHSQFVRPVAGEPFRYGPPSKFWESLFDIPQTYGTRRIGPDLAREAGRRTDDWHFAHLYNPRYVVPISVMPSYPWMFEADRTPKQEAVDLVTYLQGVGAAYIDDVKEIVNPKPVKIVGPVKHQFAALERGQELFNDNCIGCHGTTGEGSGEANKFLKPTALNLTNRYMAATEVFSVLNSGVRGTSMPSFQEMPEKDLWALSVLVNKMGAHLKQEAKDANANPGAIANGKAIYEAQCVSCHGVDGNPPNAMQEALQPPPRVFAKRLFSKEALAKVLAEGRVGTSMPAFADLAEEEVDNIQQYLTTLFEEDPE